MIRMDKDLENVRKDLRFKELIDNSGDM